MKSEVKNVNEFGSLNIFEYARFVVTNCGNIDIGHYPVLVDNGRYSHYQLEAGSYREYIRQDFCRPDEVLYVVGSREGRSNGRKMETGEKRDLRR